MSTVHFEPTISAAPATEHVGVSWTESIVRVAIVALYGPIGPRPRPPQSMGRERTHEPSHAYVTTNFRNSRAIPIEPG